MTTKILGHILIFLLLASCNQLPKENDRKVDISELDRLHWHNDSQKPFVASVKQFYQSLQKKDWEKTYEFRTNDFKEMVNLSNYIATANSSDQSWSLRGYEILSVVTHVIEGQEPALVRLIMKFNEHNTTTYNVVWWIKESNGWHCLEPGPIGPSGLSMLFADGRIANYLLKQFKKYDENQHQTK